MVSAVKDKNSQTRQLFYRKYSYTYTRQSQETKAKPVAEQSMTQVIIHAVTEAAKAATMTIREADNQVNNVRLVHATPRSGGPALKQMTSD